MIRRSESSDTAVRVAFVRGSQRVWRGLTSAWRATPAGARRRWAATLGAGLGACVVLSALLTVAGMQAVRAGSLDWEREWLVEFERSGRLSFHSAIWLEGLGSSAMIMPVVVAAVVAAALSGRGMRALLLIAAYLPAKVLIFTGWTLWNRSRPDFIADGLAVPGALHSYPSGHTLQTITVYGLLTWFWVRASGSRIEQVIAWVLLALLVAAVALARLRLGTHWPSDIAAGVLIGVAWLAVLAAADAGLRRDQSR